MIKIKIEGTKLSVTSPYHPDFPAAARKLGGKWQSPAWVFDARDEERVRKLCVRVYGTDGSAPADVLTVRCSAALCDGDGNGSTLSYYLCGRQVARAFGRDSGAKLGEGVIVLSGGFGSGGSVKNPSCTVREGTIIEVRDLPRAAAEKLHDEYRYGVTLLDATGAVVCEPTGAVVREPTVAEPEVVGPTEAETTEVAVSRPVSPCECWDGDDESPGVYCSACARTRDDAENAVRVAAIAMRDAHASHVDTPEDPHNGWSAYHAARDVCDVAVEALIAVYVEQRSSWVTSSDAARSAYVTAHRVRDGALFSDDERGRALLRTLGTIGRLVEIASTRRGLRRAHLVRAATESRS